ncbi:MAG: hypothetical protein KQI62_03765 [Deltaproteobacteria bacterium]|nr:hypothetical protein [Deltaproteobacteria bacterium]
MKRRTLIKELILLSLLVAILAGLPLGIYAYDRHVWQERIPAGAKVFSLTGNTQLGWLPGRVKGYDVVGIEDEAAKFSRPLFVVDKGDTVVFKLGSSDVIHGFSLKDFGIFIEDGVRPGKVKLVQIKADKPGVFVFSCNIICGDHHKNMKGTLIVRA